MVYGFSVKSTTVDSIPMLQLPPSKIISISPCISLYTSCALVGDGLPDLFADGAAIGQFDLSIKNLAISSDGFLIATVFPPQWTWPQIIHQFLLIFSDFRR